MTLLNYSTKISVDKTISEIQKTLFAHGATGVYAEAENGLITTLLFKIDVEGQIVGFRLPNRFEAVLSLMKNDKKVPGSLKTPEQALRVSRRILKVWIDAQMAIIETQMVKPEQVFLPYAVQRDGKTVYESLLNSGNGSLFLGS